MTTPERPAVPVFQIDREAAAAFYECHLARPGEVPVAEAMRKGEIDDSPLIRAFAHHGGATLGLRPEVVAFARLMEARLLANDHKPGWKRDSVNALCARVDDEATQLWAALDVDAAAIGDGAADVANFAMMVADVSGALGS